MYKITKEQYHLAKHIGVEIFPSDNPKYKLDIYDQNGLYILSCGANGYNDYFIYKNKNGIDIANKKRELYYSRHYKDLSKIGSKGWYSWILLWNGE